MSLTRLQRRKKTELEQLDTRSTKETRKRRRIIDDSPTAPKGKSKVQTEEKEKAKRQPEELPPRKKSLVTRTKKK